MALQIEQLLEKYWAGETSPDEEREIREYFRSHPDHSTEGQYFGQVDSKKEIEPQKGFVHPGKRIQRRWLSAAAAVILALLSIPLFYQQEEPKDKFAVSDPKEAFEITKASLMMVSEGLNKGKTYTAEELGKLNEAKNTVQVKQ